MIDKLRKEIDDIDEKLAKLFDERMMLAKKIGEEKAKNQKIVLDENREKRILEHVESMVKPEIKQYIKQVYEVIFETSRDYQRSLTKQARPKYGLVGEKLSHSFSPFIHENMGYGYGLFEISSDKLADFVTSCGLKGYNVTIPYKEKIMQYLDFVDERANAVGAVNTVICCGGEMRGYNTDIDGMKYALKRSGITIGGKKVLVLGSGGTSKTAVATARELGARETVIISRRGEDNYGNISKHFDSEIIINTTPVEMYPGKGRVALDLADFTRLSGVFDAIYNPLQTRLLQQAKKLKIPCSNGLAMLVAQAKYARDLFFCGAAMGEGIIEGIIKKMTLVKRNIVLIGMPSSGKSVIGKLLAEKMKLDFVDIDTEIEKIEGRSIPEIFANAGETYFRNTESRVTEDVSATGGKVIATGGGTVLSEKNVEELRLNGTLVYIKRELNDLSSSGRPLSATREKIARLYVERTPIYDKICDISAENDSDIASCVNKIMEQI